MKTHSCPRLWLATAFLPLLAAFTCTRAATVTWDAGGDGSSWHDPVNWSGDTLPGASDDVAITAAGAEVTFSTGEVTVQSLNCPRTLRLTGGTLTVTGDASFSDGALRLSGGNFAGTAVLVNGTLDLSGTETTPATFILRAASQFSGNISTGQTVWVQGSGNGGHANAVWTSGWRNAGTLRLESINSTWTSRLSLPDDAPADAFFTNEAGGLLLAAVGAGGERRFVGRLDNRGLISVTGGSRLLQSLAEGPVLLLPATGRIEADPDSAFELLAGELHLTGGGLAGRVVADNSRLRLDAGAAGSGPLVASGNCLLEAHTATTELWVQGSGQFGHATLETLADAPIGGPVRFESINSTWRSSFNVAAGARLLETGTLRVAAGAGGSRNFTGRLSNAGRIEVAEDSFTQFTGSYTGAGGSTAGPFVVVDSTVDFTSPPRTPPGRLTVAGNQNWLRSDLPAGQTLRLEGRSAHGHARLQLTNDLAIAGTLELESINSTWSETVVVEPGRTLTVLAGGELRVGTGAGGPRSLEGRLVNHGSINVDAGSFFIHGGLPAPEHVQQGGNVTVGEGGRLELSGGRFDWQAGPLSGDVLAINAAVNVAATVTSPSTLILAGNDGLILEGNASSAATLWVRGESRHGHARLRAADHAVNRGTIRLESINSTWQSNLSADEEASLINEGLVSVGLGAGGPREFSGEFIHRGRIEVADGTHFILRGGFEAEGGLISGSHELLNIRLRVTAAPPSPTTYRLTDAVGELLTGNLPGTTLRLEGNGSRGHARLAVPADFINQGTFELTSISSDWQSTLLVPAGGSVSNAPGASLLLATGVGGGRTVNGPVNNAGRLELGGNANIGGDVVNHHGGLVLGFGTLNMTGHTFRNEGGLLVGNPYGGLRMTGSFEQAANGQLTLKLGGTAEQGGVHDQLVVDGPARLGGTLNVAAPQGFLPEVDDEVLLLSAGSRLGQFDPLELPQPPASLAYSPRYLARELRLRLIEGDPTLAPPLITQQPTGRFATTGTEVIYGVTASGSDPLSYQWFFNGGAMTGQTNPAVTVTAGPATDGTYSVEVLNAAGSVVSDPATLTLLSGVIPADVAVRPGLPPVPGDGTVIELYNGIGGGPAPRPADLDGLSPSGVTRSPVVDFPHPNASVGVGGQFEVFFADTTVPPESVRGLAAANFILRTQPFLAVSRALDLDPATPAIEIQLGVGSDDGFDLRIGEAQLGSAGDRGFTYTWMAVAFADEGLYPLSLLFAANAVGSSGLEFSWRTALTPGGEIIPQSALYTSPDLGDRLLTFEELPVGTVISNQFAALGVVITTTGGVQVSDAKPTQFVPVSPTRVLGDPATEGAAPGSVEFQFTGPNGAGTGITDFVSFVVIDAEATGAVVTAFDPDGVELHRSEHHGGGGAQERVTIIRTNIARVVVTLGSGGDTVAVDNFSFTAPAAFNRPPQITGPTELAVEEGTVLNTQFVADDPDNGDNVVFTLVPPFPAGVVLNPQTGALSWPVTEAQGPGSYTVRVRVTDSAIPPLSADHVLAVTVSEVNQNPTLPPYGPRLVNAGDPFELQLIAFDADLPPQSLTFTLESGPAGLQLTPQGLLTWTAPAGANGDFPVNFRVSDGFSPAGSASGGLIIRVFSAPDLQITRLEAPAEGETGAPFTATYRESNLGTAPAMGSWTQRLWLSSDNRLDDQDTLLGEFPFNGTVNPGQFVERTLQFRFPNIAGNYWLIAAADAGNAIVEGTEDNNLRIAATPILVGAAYSANVATELETGLAGTPILLTGSAQRPGGAPAAFEIVNIHLKVRGTRRVIAALTDEQGRFSTTFRPLPGEAGDYTIGAAHPGDPDAPVQDSFRLLGMEFAPAQLDFDLRALSSQGRATVLRNLSEGPLTGLTSVIEGLPDSLAVEIELPASLAGGEEVPLNVAVLSEVDETIGGTAVLRVLSVEGTVATLRLNIQTRSLAPVLAATPSNLTGAMLRGDQTAVHFEIRNDGGRATGPLNVLLPAVPWMAMANPSPLPPLNPGETASLSLLLTPAADQPLTIYPGHLVVTDGEAGVTVPFSFAAVSDALATLQVEAVDEYTYYAEGSPRVIGARVEVFNKLTGVKVTERVTGTDGRVAFEDLPEGYYEVRASAADHNDFTGTVLVTAGGENELQAFLVRQAVKYYFTVEEVDLEERTRITVESVFETVVPMPVVTVEPNFLDLNAITQDRVEYDLKVTNHGLVAAQNVRLDFGSSSRFRFTPLITELGDLPARSSLTVPLLIERIKPEPSLPAATRAGISRHAGGDCPGGSLLYQLICGPRTNTYSVGIGMSGTGCGGGFAFGGGGGGYGGGGGGMPVFFGSPVPCDPCGAELAKAIAECIIGFLPIPDPIACLKDGAGCLEDPSWLGCAGALVSCLKAAGKEIPYIGEILAAIDCMDKLQNACQGGAGGSGSPLARAGIDRSAATVAFPGLAEVIEQNRRLKAIIAGYDAIIGNGAWFHPAQTGAFSTFLADFADTITAASEAGERVSEAERAALLAGTLPVGVDAAGIHRFLDRWNRSHDYAARGIVNLADVPAGESTDFIPRDLFQAGIRGAADAIILNEQEGFLDPLAAAKAAVDQLRSNLAEAAGTGGICARVRLRLDQEAVQTRQGFKATLELVNDSGEPLEGVQVSLTVRDESGAPANGLFGITAPELTDLGGVDGTGTVAPGTTGKAVWTIIPGHEAAPSSDPARYSIGGEFSYVQAGTAVRIPLTPVDIDVHPTPRLALTYFHERDVRSDDPFTDEIEPSIPYSLAVLVKNTGFGAARNLRITSSQPKIIENEKGLLINFDLIATQVGTESLTPSLTADFGDVPPGGTRQGRWLFKSSLQGQFIEYSATFEHLGVFSQFPELASIQSVDIHELIHIVRATGEGDDGLPDFLVNDMADNDYLPDTLHFSQGGTEPVSAVREATFDGAPTTGDLEVSFTATAPAGWVYFRLPDFGNGDFQVTRVLRADGSEVPFGDNVWTTDRTFVAGGRRPKYEFSLHVFDRVPAAGPVTYRVIYNTPPEGDTTAPGSQVAVLPASSGPQIPVQWSGTDNDGGSGLGSFDVYVSVDGGDFLIWQRGVTTRGAIYPGETGKTYAFYTVAVDNAGNREAAPATPDATTTVNRSNAAPELTVPATLAVDEGAAAAFVATAADADLPADVLTFSLGPDAPPGAQINARTGAFSWPTGEGTGPVTNRFTVTVTDNGIPSLADSAVVEVIVREVNQAPVIAPLVDVVVNEGSPLVVPVLATDSDLPAQPLTYRLGAPLPAGLGINAAGVIAWTPDEFQGPDTNRVEVFVSDGVVESFASFRVIVRDVRPDFTLTAGRTHLFAGRSGLLPIVVEAGVDLTANFRLDLLNPATAAGFSGLTFTPGAGLFSAASLTPAGALSYAAQLTLAPGAAANGPQTAMLAFEVAGETPSGRVRVHLHDATGTFGETVLTRPRLRDGRIIVINREPVLELDDARSPRLNIFGRPGVQYRLWLRETLDAAGFGLRTLTVNDTGLLEEAIDDVLDGESGYLQVIEVE